MDKLIQRTANAQKQAARRVAASAKRNHRRDYRDRIRRAKAAVEDYNRNVHNARRVRHERWELGPLAPKRTLEHGYGLAKEHARAARQAGESMLRPFEREARCEWAGGTKYLNLVAGDRVVIMDGHDKGNIDTISSVSAANGTVELKEFGKIVAKTPDWLIGKEVNGQIYPNHSVTSTAVPISAVRLVHPITDPATGVTRDVIIRKLAHSNVRRDRLTTTVEWDRYVPGLNTIIPWPEKEDPEAKQHKGDTARADVQDATFVPTLLRAPMPEQLVNELRNRYSKFRTRHEAWYIEKKMFEADAPKRAKKEADLMITPQEELNRQRKEQRRALGKPELSEGMLEKIGELMAKAKAKSEANKSA